MKYSSQEQLPAARRTGPRSSGATRRVPLSGQIPKIIGESRFLQGKPENFFLRPKIFRGGTGAGGCRDDGSEADSLISLPYGIDGPLPFSPGPGGLGPVPET